jgi:imidazoleglycerol phosphate synthase glutamine amidotransferase subunit HisH
MVQGGKKISNIRPGEIKKSGNSAKVQKVIRKQHKAKKGTPLQLPKGKFHDEAFTDRLLSKAIDKANEQKMAAKALQSGVRVGMKDLLTKGKELNRESKRKLLKNKVGRVEEKLKELEQKAEATGLL